MQSENSLRVADILMNGNSRLSTSWGSKTQIGIADLLDNEVVPKEQIQNLVDSADDTGCDGDLIVVGKAALVALADRAGIQHSFESDLL